MFRKVRLCSVLVLGVIATANAAHAQTWISNRTLLTGGTLDWATVSPGYTAQAMAPVGPYAIGPDGNTVRVDRAPLANNPGGATTSFISQYGPPGSGYTTGNWPGMFALGERLLASGGSPSALTFTFSTPIYGFGTQVQSSFKGDQSRHWLVAYSQGVVQGVAIRQAREYFFTDTYPGKLSGASIFATAPFIGFVLPQPFDKVELFSEFLPPGVPTSFFYQPQNDRASIINAISIRSTPFVGTPSTTVPEPATIVLSALGLIGVFVVQKRRK